MPISPKKILLFSNSAWYLHNFRSTTIEHLIESNYEIIALSPWDNSSDKLKQLGCRIITSTLDPSGRNPLSDLASVYQLRKILNHEKPAVLLNFTPKCCIYGTLAAHSLKTPSINNISGVGAQLHQGGLTAAILKLLYRSQRLATHVFFQNNADMKYFLENNYVTASKASRLLGSGVNLKRFTYSRKPKTSVFRFLLFGRLIKEKGVYEFVDVAKHMKQSYGEKVQFDLVGFAGVKNPSAIDRQTLQAWVDKGHINYHEPTTKIEHFIESSDCIVLPSYYGEGVPKSLLEAAAVGRPIITTDHPGCRDAIDDGISGILCSPQSTKSLLDASETIFNKTESELIAMGKSARQKAEAEFSDIQNINHYKSQITSILEQRQPQLK